jgi:hypothetical protein
MHRHLLFFLAFTFLSTPFFGQRLVSFSENDREFISQMQDLLTASKTKSMEELYEEFEDLVKNGVFTTEDLQVIRSTGNIMLANRMSANPYFSNYLRGLLQVKNAENGQERFKRWHEILTAMLEDEENRKSRPFQTFLKFSYNFFENNTLRSSDTGIQWEAVSTSYEMVFEEKLPQIVYEKVDLVASRKSDSLVILKTSGAFLPTQGAWKGKGGIVNWEKAGLGEDVYVELGPYEIDVKKSLYEVREAKLHYPVYFKNRAIPGKFIDKATSFNPNIDTSYPRFESDEDVLEIDNFGRGIEYKGGFRLHGSTIYGIGSKENPAEISIFNKRKELTLSAKSEFFTIRPEDRIVGEGVECSLLFDPDSLYHPSVDFRYEIQSQQLKFSRGQRGSDRNPFFSSLHQMNIDAEDINYYIDQDSIVFGEKSLTFSKRRTPVVFESLNYFEESDYYRFQNIATFNPIAVIKAVSEKEGTRFLNADYLAERMDSRFTVENIKSLLYDLVSKGFINYDSDKQIVEVKDKIYHYANASLKKVDYDAIRIESESDETNAVLDLKSNDIAVSGVQNIVFSVSQRVGLKPYGDYVTIKPNRDMDFAGKLYAGYTTMEGKDFHFEYDPFHIRMDSVRFFDIFLESDELENGKPKAESISSRIEHAQGVLLIDAPQNKSGREQIKMFPSFQSKKYSYVFYDYDGTQKGAYKRDSFYFQLDPFSFNDLDFFKKEDLSFDGEMYSADIFPVFTETLSLQEDDYSLGFETKTPDDGYLCYREKGVYTGDIDLNNKGLLGQGHLQYLGASINSEDFVFKPKQLEASAERFDHAEDRESAIEVPQAIGLDVKIDWRPYKDSMYVTTKEKPFDIFKDGVHQLEGTLILTPGGLKSKGEFSWPKAKMRSDLFSFGAHSISADTTDLRINAFNADDLALETQNLNGYVDFDEQRGQFEGNENHVKTTLPHNQYETTMDHFDWDIDGEKITFLKENNVIGSFWSIHPDQDSLWFKGEAATYDLRTSELEITGVDRFVSADAFIYPDTNVVVVEQGGVMRTLENARIVADTVNQFHVINRAVVNVKGKKDFTATGFYEYNVGDKEQEIMFDNIAGIRVGKGSRTEKRVATRATGEVAPADRFYIDHKMEYRGQISLYSETKNLQFEGFARMDAKLPNRQWFSVNFEGDRSDLAIEFDTPKNYNGDPLKNGIYLSKETARTYPRIMEPLYFRKDRPILPVTGLLKYNKAKDQFIFGDSIKVVTPGYLRGNQMIFDNKTGKLDIEGKFNVGSGLEFVSVEAAGRGETGVEILTDSLGSNSARYAPLNTELMAGINLIIPEELMKMIQTDFESSAFNAPSVIYASDPNFYKKATAELFPIEEKDIQDVLSGLNLNAFELPKKFNPYTFLFSRIPMKWEPDYQSFISTEEKLSLASINGQTLNRKVTAYVEFRMPQDGDDRLYVYLRSPSGFYYFFGFKQGIMNVVSNNTKFQDAVFGMKDKDRIQKTKDGRIYEIAPVEPSSAQAFVNRVLAVN